jgi:hypothetical protein
LVFDEIMAGRKKRKIMEKFFLIIIFL